MTTATAWTVAGSCPKCGSPIWSNGARSGDAPPETFFSCQCNTQVGRPGQVTLPPPQKDPKVERCELGGGHAVMPTRWPLPPIINPAAPPPFDAVRCIRCGVTVVLESGKHSAENPPAGVTILVPPALNVAPPAPNARAGGAR